LRSGGEEAKVGLEPAVDAGLRGTKPVVFPAKGLRQSCAGALDDWRVMRRAERQVKLPSEVNQITHGAVDLLDALIAANGGSLEVAEVGATGHAGAKRPEAAGPGDAAAHEITDEGDPTGDGADAADGGKGATDQGIVLGLCQAAAPLDEMLALLVEANEDGLKSIGFAFVKGVSPDDDVRREVNDAIDAEWC